MPDVFFGGVAGSGMTGSSGMACSAQGGGAFTPASRFWDSFSLGNRYRALNPKP